MTPIFDEIRPSELGEWAAKGETDRWMPSLLQQLIFGSGAALSECRFLTHEQTNLGGWDGIVKAESSGFLVPQGTSGWELSRERSERAEAKALEDISKRTADPAPLRPVDSTLVVVTLRVWPRRRKSDGSYAEADEHIETWCREQAERFGWSAVRVIDAVTLAGWIARQPGVSVWLASVMGREVRGAESLVGHWQKLEKLKSSPDVFLAGRSQFVSCLEDWLAKPEEGAFEVRSWSHEDVRDTLAAWWRNRVDAGAMPGICPMLVQSREAWRYLSAAARPLLLAADGGLELAPEEIASAASQGHRVIVRTQAGHACGPGARLPALDRDALTEALKADGRDYNLAWRRAGDAGGSGVVLKRLLSGLVAEPEWARDAGAASLAPVVLFGAWDAACEADRNVLAAVFGCPYAKIEESLRPWCTANHPLLSESEGSWRVLSREDAWRFLSVHLQPAHYRGYREEALRVLSEIDPRYDLPPEERIYASIQKKTPRHSRRLRHATAETLCLIGLRPPEAGDGARAGDMVCGIVGELLSNATDWRLWASLGAALPLVAEAAPDVFLRAIETDLKRESPAVAELFRQAGEGVFGDHPHVQLMWALEALLWEREWVARSSLVLARLASLDPGGHLSPRPMGVLRETFLPWQPQCCLDVGDRCRVLHQLMKKEPAVAWELFLNLLPKAFDGSSPRQRPRFRNVEGGDKQGVTVAEYWDQVEHVARGLIDAATAVPEKWADLVKKLARLPDEVFAEALARLDEECGGFDSARRDLVWEALHAETSKHRFFCTAEWRMSPDRLERMERLATKLRPVDPVTRLSQLFGRRFEAHPSGVTSKTSWDEAKANQTEAQASALREILASGGIEALRRLLSRIGEFEAGQAGVLAASSSILRCDDAILPAWLEEEGPAFQAFARGYARARFDGEGWTWIADLDCAKWNPESFAELSNIFPMRERTWSEVESLGPRFADAYWSAVSPWLHGASEAEVARILREMLSHGRSLAALDSLPSERFDDAMVSLVQVLAVLEAVREHLIARPEALREWGDFQMFEHHLASSLAALQRAEDLEAEMIDRIQELEWFFLPFLGEFNCGKPRRLLRKLREDPAFFVDLLSASGFRPDQETADLEIEEWTEARINHAKLCRQLLSSLRKLPGLRDNGALDESAFRDWIDGAGGLAEAAGYRVAFERALGEWLLYSPVDKDGRWPASPVCRLLTEGPQDLADAFKSAIFNNQGWPGPLRNTLSMSSLEDRRKAVETLRGLAEKLTLDFPAVASLLRRAERAQEDVLRRRANSWD
jgi:hypothetical protein